MKNKQVICWFLDILIILVFLGEYSLNLTGLQLHELLGLFVFGLLLVHYLIHEQWLQSVSKRLFNSSFTKASLNYLVDMSLFVLFTTITLTGLVISSLLNLSLAFYAGWHFLHVSASYLTLAVAGLKIALHWRWIVQTASRKIFRRQNASRAAAPVTGFAESSGETKRMSRRQFLEGTGIFAGAVLFAGIEYSDWVQKHVQSDLLAASSPSDLVSSSATPFQPQAATSTSTQVASPSADLATTVPTLMPQQNPTAVQLVQPVKTTVRCTRGCSYPGQCRRYTDSNQNNRCDLSEW